MLMDIDPRKRRERNKGSFWEMSLMYSPSSGIRFEFNQSCNKACTFNLINVGLSMCVMEYLDSFLNLMTKYVPILAFISRKRYGIIPAWRGKVVIALILHGGRKLCWLMWFWCILYWERSFGSFGVALKLFQNWSGTTIVSQRLSTQWA